MTLTEQLAAAETNLAIAEESERRAAVMLEDIYAFEYEASEETVEYYRRKVNRTRDTRHEKQAEVNRLQALLLLETEAAAQVAGQGVGR